MSSMLKVAREANVAVSTVSLALNHRERVKPETLERIEQAIRRVGYRPRRKVRDTRQPKQLPMRVAFIYTLESLNIAVEPSMSSYCREIISGMQGSLAGTSSSLSIIRGVDHVDHDLIVNEQLGANEFDGVILFGADARNGYLDRLQRSGLPLVVMNHLPQHGQCSCVTLDYFGGAEQAVKHLLSLGHRRIAMMLDDDPARWPVREVSEGAREALAGQGLSMVSDHVGLELRSPEFLERFLRQALDQQVTAIFGGDHLAVRCADLLMRWGIRVPEDVSIIGFDDRGVLTGNGLKVTTIGYDKQRMGRMAVRMLQQLAQSRGKLRWLAGAVATRLVNGQTTAEAAGAKTDDEVPEPN